MLYLCSIDRICMAALLAAIVGSSSLVWECSRSEALREIRAEDATQAPAPKPDQTKGVPEAIQAGLCWLARHQNPDGSWSASKLHERCTPGNPCFEKDLNRNDHYAEGTTGLALLCFVRAGYGPESKNEILDPVTDKHYLPADVLTRGFEWLRARQNKDGSFTPERPFMYNDAIAALAFAEAFGRSKFGGWKAPSQKALDLIEDSQRSNPSGKGSWGWRYESRREVEREAKGQDKAKADEILHSADTSVSAWCVAALRAGQVAGLRVKAESLSGALDFCRFVTAEDGKVGYLDPRSAGEKVVGPFSDRFTYHPTTMAAAGICIRMSTSRLLDDPALRRAADWIRFDLPAVTRSRDSVDYYYWYYGSAALFSIDGPESPRKSGKYWIPWRKAVVESVLSLQDHTEKACRNGGWIECDRWGLYSGFGPLVGTTLCILTLEFPTAGH